MGATDSNGPGVPARLSGVLGDGDGFRDPTPALKHLAQSPDTVPFAEVDALWRMAVEQCALAEVGAITHQPIRLDWRDGWQKLEELLRDALLQTATVPDLPALLVDYERCTRAEAAAKVFHESVRNLEYAVVVQQSLIAFHWNEEENAYRRRETEISDQIGNAYLSEGERTELGKRLGEEIGRYRSLYLPRLRSVERDVAGAAEQAFALADMLPVEAHPLPRRWADLTRTLLAARVAAVANVEHRLDFDAITAEAALSGELLVTKSEHGAELRYSENATSRFKEAAAKAGTLLQESIVVEEPLSAERDDVVRQLLGTAEPRHEPAPVEDTSREPEAQRTRTAHPLARKAWYRLARLLAGCVLALWILLVGALFPSFGAVLVAAACGAAVLYAIRAAVLYVILGRTTLHERDGSGFVDVSVLEEQLLGASTQDDPQTGVDLQEFRRRYGQRVPATVVEAWLQSRLAQIAESKRQAIVDADRDGRRIKLSDLRARFLTNVPPDVNAGDYRAHWERVLLRLEVQHGPEVPFSALAALVDDIESLS